MSEYQFTAIRCDLCGEICEEKNDVDGGIWFTCPKLKEGEGMEEHSTYYLDEGILN